MGKVLDRQDTHSAKAPKLTEAQYEAAWRAGWTREQLEGYARAYSNTNQSGLGSCSESNVCNGVILGGVGVAAVAAAAPVVAAKIMSSPVISAIITWLQSNGDDVVEGTDSCLDAPNSTASAAMCGIAARNLLTPGDQPGGGKPKDKGNEDSDGIGTAPKGGIVRDFGQHPNAPVLIPGKGKQTVLPDAQPDANELTAGKVLADLGYDVVHRKPVGQRKNGGTSDMLVNGVQYDAYNPTTSKPDRIVEGIKQKDDQAIGIVVDLRQSNATVEQMGDVMGRLKGKGAQNIAHVIFIKSVGE